MSHRCLIEDDLQMPYQKMSCRCLIEDDLQMSYQKKSCMRCLKDVLYNLSLIYLQFCIRYIKLNLEIPSLSNLVLQSYNTLLFQTFLQPFIMVLNYPTILRFFRTILTCDTSKEGLDS